MGTWKKNYFCHRYNQVSKYNLFLGAWELRPGKWNPLLKTQGPTGCVTAHSPFVVRGCSRETQGNESDLWWWWEGCVQPEIIVIKELTVLVTLESLYMRGQGTEDTPLIYLVLLREGPAGGLSSQLWIVQCQRKTHPNVRRIFMSLLEPSWQQLPGTNISKDWENALEHGSVAAYFIHTH